MPIKNQVELPPPKKLEEIDFQYIIANLKPSKSSKYRLPRITFVGYFKYLSMTSQRDICKHLGFEYYSNIELGTTDEAKMQILTTKWNVITKAFTKLVVIGNCYDSMPEWHFNVLLYKQYKKENSPVIFKYNIPVIMEEELWKLHLDYPNISNNTIWESEFMVPISKSGNFK